MSPPPNRVSESGGILSAAHAIEPMPIVEPDPDTILYQKCVKAAKANHARPSPGIAFSSSVSVSWNVKPPSYCTGIQYFFNGKSVPAAWSEWVLTSTTTVYHLTAKMGNYTAHLSSTTVIRTNVITYTGSYDAVAARTAATNLT